MILVFTNKNKIFHKIKKKLQHFKLPTTNKFMPQKQENIEFFSLSKYLIYFDYLQQ